jgi:aspartyl/asparaginyl beta-hydroxylase (cupin superfamily)
MFNIYANFICIGIVVIIFIISVSLLIFAPKSINYYTPDTYPILKSINDNNKDIINNDFEKIENDTNWLAWPDSKNTSGTCEVFPMYMFSTESKSRKNKCIASYNLIQNIPGVKTCSFIKIDKKSRIKKQTQWKNLSNTTLRCLFTIKSVSSAPVETCGIWVNGETKKLISNSLVIFDSSKEHSIYNDTDYPIYALMIDVQRPEKIPDGISQREYSDELYDFVCTLNTE